MARGATAGRKKSRKLRKPPKATPKPVRHYRPREHYTPVHWSNAQKFFEQFVNGHLAQEGIRLEVVSKVIPFLRSLGLVTVTSDRPTGAARALLSQQLHRARYSINGAAGHPSFDPHHQFKIASNQRGKEKFWIIKPLKVFVEAGPLNVATSIRSKVKSCSLEYERDRIKLMQSLIEHVGSTTKSEELMEAINLHYAMMQRTMNGIADNIQSLCDHLIKYQKRIELPPIARDITH